MLFSSLEFFAFFGVYFVFHFLIPNQYRIFLIICGSTIFYAWWKIEYVWLPYLLMAIAYFGTRWMDGATVIVARRRRMLITIVVLFLPLIIFKYANFVYVDVYGALVGGRDRLLDLSLPLGVSFITFTMTAYVVDIYRNTFSSAHGGATVLGYVLFFPHLIAGPILRPAELIPQLEHPRRKASLAVAAGVAIFTLGLVKKLVVADPIADVVDAIYANLNPSGPAALIAIYGFSVQIYCDFSGYTDMAIGLALLLGIRLPNNFHRPYLAGSLVDFWRRWHVTLSFWFRDYLYIPLGGNRGGLVKETRNILVTMTIAGLWHGANWTFILWGLLHGIGLSILHALRHIGAAPLLRAMPCWLCLLLTFHFVTLAWVYFRAPSFTQAHVMLAALFTGGGWGGASELFVQNIFPLILIFACLTLHRFDDHRRVRLAVRRIRAEIIWPIIALGWVLALTVSHGNSAKFIYFDF